MVVENTPLNREHYLLGFSPLSETLKPRPGQFYMVSAWTGIDPLLKRPFCFLDRSGEEIRILYRVRGKGTELLKDRRVGDEIDIIGPLGNSYPRPQRGLTPLIVAGGTAIASVFPHIKALRGRARVVYGAKNSGELLMLDELESLASEVSVCTEDGSLGLRGTALDALGRMEVDSGHLLYVCGSKGMVRAIAEFARERDIKGYASLEEYMACGIGACMGCVVGTPGGYRRVCREGPIFRLSEIAP